MRLEKIEINGFKSFADKTEILLDGSITGIVGPNGSGKSNIADAVRWVLGEQNSKNLRGAKMEDVIFGGTQSRHGKALCEVSLYFDNSDGRISSEYAEISISRKMFRSGESEYYINRNSVRLKDILDLFRDTGIGKEGYSIIGQGRIDEILSSKPLARRKVFEEAAGVMKFRTRKEESEHKLERTEENLTRIADILQELNAQALPMKEQAEKTKSYLALFERQKLLEANIYVINYERVHKKVEKLEDDLSSLEEELQKEQREFEGSVKQTESISNALLRMDEALTANRNLLSEMLSEAEKAAGIKNLLLERIAVARRDTERVEAEKQALLQRMEVLLAEKEAKKQELLDLTAKIEKIDVSIAAQSAEKNRIAEVYAAKRMRAQCLRAEHLSVLSKKSGLESRLAALKMREEAVLSGIAQLLQNEQEATVGLEAARTRLNDAAAALASVRADMRQLTALQNENTLHINENKKQNMELLRVLEKSRAAQRDAASRITFLQGLQTEYEGYSVGVKNLMRGASADPGLARGLLGTLAELVEVPQEYEAAVEAALGGALQNVVAETEEDAKRAISYLREKRLGRVSFMPLSALKVRKFSKNEIADMGRELLIAADQGVQCDEKIRPAVEFLLGRTAIVKDMDGAIALARKTGYTFRIVTLPGDVINPGGIISGGSTQQKSYGLLSRKRDIERAEQAAKLAGEQISLLEAKRRAAEREQETLQTENEALLNKLKHLGIAEAEGRMAEQTAKGDAARLEVEQGRIALLLKKSGEEKAQNAKEVELILQEIEQAGRIALDIAQELQSLDDKGEEDSAVIEDTLSGLKVERAQLEKDQQSIGESISRLDVERATLEGQLKEKQEAVLGIQALLANTVAEQTKAEEASNRQKEDVLRLQGEVFEAEQAHKRLSAELAQKQKRGAEFQLRQASLMDSKYKLENQKDRLTLSIENLGNRLWEDYGMTYADAVLLKKEMNYTECAQEASEIREKIRGLGTVNPNAIEDYSRLYERIQELTVQKEDLEKAKNDLRKVIENIMASMKTAFVEKFAQINKNFNEVFQTLFGGGKASLFLEEGDVMECGIEISVEPPGKKLQHISLLSGGEQALTGIALLFAMIRINPSPFCLLDEIDAPLDDANVLRFCNYIQKIGLSQFLIITHKKTTMSICSALFGVSMEEKGISKLVSVRID